MKRRHQFINHFPRWVGIRKKEYFGWRQVFCEYGILLGWFEISVWREDQRSEK